MPHTGERLERLHVPVLTIQPIMSHAERTGRKRKRRLDAASNRTPIDSPELDWFSPTQASLGLNKASDQSRNITALPAHRHLAGRRQFSTSATGDEELSKHDLADIEWEQRRLMGKRSNIGDVMGEEQVQGTGLVIWDEDDGLDAVHFRRCV